MKSRKVSVVEGSVGDEEQYRARSHGDTEARTQRLQATSLTVLFLGRVDRNSPQVSVDCISRDTLFT